MRIEKKTAVASADLMTAMIKYLKVAPALNTRRIFAAWNDNSGIAEHTVHQFFRNGKLTVTLDSSMLRTILNSRKREIMDSMNIQLAKDDLFIKDDPKVGFVEEIVLK